MYRVILIVLLAVFIGQSQIPLYLPNQVEGAQSKRWTTTGTDTNLVIQYYFYPDYKIFTGAAALFGNMVADSAGYDTLTTINCRLIMRHWSASSVVLYDSTGYHNLATEADAGDYIPAEDEVGTTPICWSINLSNKNFWKPCVGIEIQFINNQKTGMSKKIEPYLNTIYYQWK